MGVTAIVALHLRPASGAAAPLRRAPYGGGGRRQSRRPNPHLHLVAPIAAYLAQAPGPQPQRSHCRTRQRPPRQPLPLALPVMPFPRDAKTSKSAGKGSGRAEAQQADLSVCGLCAQAVDEEHIQGGLPVPGDRRPRNVPLYRSFHRRRPAGRRATDAPACRPPAARPLRRDLQHVRHPCLPCGARPCKQPRRASTSCLPLLAGRAGWRADLHPLFLPLNCRRSACATFCTRT